jgi:hypothetical protein
LRRVAPAQEPDFKLDLLNSKLSTLDDSIATLKDSLSRFRDDQARQSANDMEMPGVEEPTPSEASGGRAVLLDQVSSFGPTSQVIYLAETISLSVGTVASKLSCQSTASSARLLRWTRMWMLPTIHKVLTISHRSSTEVSLRERTIEFYHGSRKVEISRINLQARHVD